MRKKFLACTKIYKSLKIFLPFYSSHCITDKIASLDTLNIPMNASMLFIALDKATNPEENISNFFSSPQVNHHPLNVNESSVQEIQRVALGQENCLSFDNEFHVVLYSQQPKNNEQKLEMYHLTDPLKKIDVKAFAIREETNFISKFQQFVQQIFEKIMFFDITSKDSVKQFISSYNNVLVSFQKDHGLFLDSKQFEFSIDDSIDFLSLAEIYNIITSFQQIFPYRFAFIDGQHRYYCYTAKENLESRKDGERNKEEKSYKYFTENCAFKLSCFFDSEDVSSQREYFVKMSNFHMNKATQVKKTMVDVLYDLLPQQYDEGTSFFKWIHSDDDLDTSNPTNINNNNGNDDNNNFEHGKRTFAHKEFKAASKLERKQGSLVGFTKKGDWKRRKTNTAQHHYSMRKYIAKSIYEVYNKLLDTYTKPLDDFRNDVRKDIESFLLLKQDSKYRTFTKDPVDHDEKKRYQIDITQHDIEKKTNPDSLCSTRNQKKNTYIPLMKMFDCPVASMSLSDIIEHNTQSIRDKGYEFLRFKAKEYAPKLLMKSANAHQQKILQDEEIWYPISKGMVLMINLYIMAKFEKRFYNLLRYALHNFNAKDFIDQCHRLTKEDDKMFDQLPPHKSYINHNSHLDRRQMFDYQSLGKC